MKVVSLTKAPGGSHVESFGMIAGESPKRGWLIEVTFRLRKGSPRSTYHYEVETERMATGILKALAQAERPGTVVHRRLIGKFPASKVR